MRGRREGCRADGEDDGRPVCLDDAGDQPTPREALQGACHPVRLFGVAVGAQGDDALGVFLHATVEEDGVASRQSLGREGAKVL